MKKAVLRPFQSHQIIIFEDWDENNDNKPFRGVLVTDQTYDAIQTWKSEQMGNNPDITDALFVEGIGFIGMKLMLRAKDIRETAIFDFELPKGYTRVYAKPKYLHEQIQLNFGIERDLINCLGNFVFNLEHTFKTPFDDDDITKMRTAMMKPNKEFQWKLSSWDLHLLSIDTELIMKLKRTIQSPLATEKDLECEFSFKEPEEICLMRSDVPHLPWYYAVGKEQIYSVLSHRLSIRQQEGTMVDVMIPALSGVTEASQLRDTLDKLQILNSAAVQQLKSLSTIEVDVEYEDTTLDACEKYVAPGETFLRDGLSTSSWLMHQLIEKIENKKGKKLTTVEKNSIIDLAFYEVRQHLTKRYPMSSFISRLISFIDVFRPSSYRTDFASKDSVHCGFEAVHRIYKAILCEGDPKYTASPYEAQIIEQLVRFDGPWFKTPVKYLKELEDREMCDEIVTE